MTNEKQCEKCGSFEFEAGYYFLYKARLADNRMLSLKPEYGYVTLEVRCHACGLRARGNQISNAKAEFWIREK